MRVNTKKGEVEVNDIPSFSTKITVVGAVTYIGEAGTGTLQATPAWRCHKIDTTTGTVITWADGNSEFDNVATDLTLLAYL